MIVIHILNTCSLIGSYENYVIIAIIMKNLSYDLNKQQEYVEHILINSEFCSVLNYKKVSVHFFLRILLSFQTLHH